MLLQAKYDLLLVAPKIRAIVEAQTKLETAAYPPVAQQNIQQQAILWAGSHTGRRLGVSPQ